MADQGAPRRTLGFPLIESECWVSQIFNVFPTDFLYTDLSKQAALEGESRLVTAQVVDKVLPFAADV